MIKDLTINGIVYAKYEIEGDIIYIKITKKLFEHEGEAEDIFVNIIQRIEKVRLKRVGYLNIKDMQEQEFNKLMQGKPGFRPPRWADMPNLEGSSKAEIREEIKQKEVIIPQKIRDAIYKYVREERKKNTKERTIRRAVMRKWNIRVV